MDGALLGFKDAEGKADGNELGIEVGCLEGVLLGPKVGVLEGAPLGPRDGKLEGSLDGPKLGAELILGASEGTPVTLVVGL